MTARVIVGVLFAIVIGAPFAFRSGEATSRGAERQLIIVTPHNEQIRAEFKRGFEAWHEANYDEAVEVVWQVPGGTSEIRSLLFSQYRAAIESGREPGGDADLIFGGGSYEHGKFKSGVDVRIDGERRTEPVSAPTPLAADWLVARYGENDVGGIPLYDPDQHWFGTAVSGFGIVYNRDALEDLGLPEPRTWADMCDPRLRGWVALVNPAQSGSVTTAFQAILDRAGWQQGWRILRRAAANARYFSGSSLKPPSDVSAGDAAMGVSIDFYGRFQAQAISVATGRDRVGYVDPPGLTSIDPDPISMLRGARDPELAQRFIEFTLTDEGQALWQFPARGTSPGLGPQTFELRRLPVRRNFLAQYGDRLIDKVDPFAIATPATGAIRGGRDFIPIIFAAMALENHEHLKEAWTAIVTHPAYPEGGGLVTADDVEDPQLAAMLRAFDAMPEVVGLDEAGAEVRYSMASGSDIGAIRAGWLKGGWDEAGLWPSHAGPAATLRRSFGAFFRDQYEAIAAGTTAGSE